MSSRNGCFYLLVTVVFLVLGGYLGNPEVEECKDRVPCWCIQRATGQGLDCMYQFLAEVPDFGSDAANFTRLELTGNDIDLNLPESILFLNNFKNLTELDLDQNKPIDGSVILNDNLFSDVGVIKLTRLNLMDCGISNIQTKAFEGLTNLLILDLTRNNLNTVPEALLVLNSLQDLYLSQNVIQTLERDSFSTLKKIELIKLSKNRIQSIDNDTFLPMKHLLGEIYLSNNLLSTIPQNAFQNIKCLFKLYLTGNQIKDLPDDVFNGSMIEVLRLDNNRIDWRDSKNWFNGLEKSLRLLDISSMNTTSLPKQSLLHLRSLRRLVAQNISMTNIGSRAFKGFPDKINIDLSNNKIESGSPTALFDSPKDLSVNLENNNIRSVSFLKTEKLCSVREVKLSGNPIECNCEVFEVVSSGFIKTVTGDCYDESGVSSSLDSKFPEYFTESCNMTTSLVTCHGGRPITKPDTDGRPGAAANIYHRFTAVFMCCLLLLIY